MDANPPVASVSATAHKNIRRNAANRPFAEWREVFPNAACVVSLIDRLIHNAEIVAIDGESYRLKEARERTELRTRQRRVPKRGPAHEPRARRRPSQPDASALARAGERLIAAKQSSCCSIKTAIPSSRPAHPVPARAAAVNDARRPPPKRRAASLTAASTAAPSRQKDDNPPACATSPSMYGFHRR